MTAIAHDPHKRMGQVLAAARETFATPTKFKPRQELPMASDQTILRTADQILAMFDNGEFLQQFLTNHQELIVALHNHQMNHGGKAKGVVTIKLNYSLDKQLTLNAEADAKFDKPKAPKAAAILWTTADGDLTPQNPRQPSLPGIRDVTAPAHSIRT